MLLRQALRTFSIKIYHVVGNKFYWKIRTKSTRQLRLSIRPWTQLPCHVMDGRKSLQIRIFLVQSTNHGVEGRKGGTMKLTLRVDTFYVHVNLDLRIRV